MKQPSELPKAKKHKSMCPDEDDEEPENEPGTSPTCQPSEPVLPLHQGPAASSVNIVHKARIPKDSVHPDLCVMTHDEHWTMTPEAHKYAAAAGFFFFCDHENGNQQDTCNLTTMPCIQRSLYLNEVINDSDSTQVEVPKGVESQTLVALDRAASASRTASTGRSFQISVFSATGEISLVVWDLGMTRLCWNWQEQSRGLVTVAASAQRKSGNKHFSACWSLWFCMRSSSALLTEASCCVGP